MDLSPGRTTEPWRVRAGRMSSVDIELKDKWFRSRFGEAGTIDRFPPIGFQLPDFGGWLERARNSPNLRSPEPSKAL
jgi:hypothetical protein